MLIYLWTLSVFMSGRLGPEFFGMNDSGADE